MGISRRHTRSMGKPSQVVMEGSAKNSRYRQSRVLLALAGLSAGAVDVSVTFAQQSPYDQTVFHTNANDSNASINTFDSGYSSSTSSSAYWNTSTTTYSIVNPGTSTYTNPATLAAKTTPTPGYAYVVTGGPSSLGQCRTSTTNTTETFTGDSLTIIPQVAPTAASLNANNMTVGVFIKSPANTVITCADLVLANGGGLLNFNNSSATLNGGIYLVDTSASLDGITPTVSGGIIDSRGGTLGLTVNSTITGPGLLHIIQSGGATASFVTLTGTNTFSGGVNLDSTVTFGNSAITGSSPYPLLKINNPSALGTGTFTITGLAGSGPEFDNTTGSSETLSTNNPIALNGSFTFLGSSSLDLGSGAVTIGSNPVTATVNAKSLSLEGAITGPNGLTKMGAGTLLLNGSSSYSGGTTVSGGILGGTGTVPSLSVLAGGTVEPGLSPTLPGLLTDSGALTFTAPTGVATLAVELTPSTSDELIVDGQANLSSGTLSISLASGYLPAVGATFTILDDQSALPTLGTFANDNGSGLVTDTQGDTFSVNYSANVDGGTIGNDVTLTFVSPVPEPASMGLLTLGVFSLLRKRRKPTV